MPIQVCTVKCGIRLKTAPSSARTTGAIVDQTATYVQNSICMGEWNSSARLPYELWKALPRVAAKIRALPARYDVPKLMLRKSPPEQRTTPEIATAKLTQRRGVIRSRRKITANIAVATGRVRLIRAALLARDIRVPHVIITCAGKTPRPASSR